MFDRAKKYEKDKSDDDRQDGQEGAKFLALQI
jgi:hypothetical protein